MAKFILQRLLIIPLLLLLVNFLGYTYAHYARPIRAARTPYVQAEEAGPLLPEYMEYQHFILNSGINLWENILSKYVLAQHAMLRELCWYMMHLKGN